MVVREIARAGNQQNQPDVHAIFTVLIRMQELHKSSETSNKLRKEQRVNVWLSFGVCWRALKLSGEGLYPD